MPYGPCQEAGKEPLGSPEPTLQTKVCQMYPTPNRCKILLSIVLFSIMLSFHT